MTDSGSAQVLRAIAERLCSVASGAEQEIREALAMPITPAPLCASECEITEGVLSVAGVTLRFSQALLMRADLDRVFGQAREVPRTGSSARHELAYLVRVAGAPACVRLFASFAEPPQPTSGAKDILLRIDPAAVGAAVAREIGSVEPFAVLLQSLLSENAQALILSEGATPRIRTRDSQAVLRDRPWSAAEATELKRTIVPAENAREYHSIGETAFLHQAGAGWFHLRLLRTHVGSTIVAKHVREDIPGLDELGSPKTVLRSALRALLRAPGLILVAGRRRSGRSTSLAAMIGFLNGEASGHIVVLEDDPRWLHRSGSCIVSQIALRPTSASRKAALRSVKGWGADVVAIDCAMDPEILAAAIDLAETGTSVIATADDYAWGTLEGIVTRCAAAVPQVKERLTNVLKVVTRQTLVPRQDRAGSVPAIEVVVSEPEVCTPMLQDDFHGIREIAKKSREVGMQTLEQALADLHLAGIISRESALRYAGSASEAALFIKLGQSAAQQTLDRTPRAVFAALMAEHGVPRIVIANASILQTGLSTFVASDASMKDEDPFKAGVSHYRTPLGTERQLAIRKYVEVEAGEIPAAREALLAMGVVEVLHRTRQGPDGRPTNVVRVAVREDVTPLTEAEVSDAIQNCRVLDVEIRRSIFGDTFVQFSITKGNYMRVDDNSMRFVFDPPCRLGDWEVSLASSYGELQSVAELLNIFRDYFTRTLGPSFRDDRNADLAALAAGLRRIPRPKDRGAPDLTIE